MELVHQVQPHHGARLQDSPAGNHAGIGKARDCTTEVPGLEVPGRTMVAHCRRLAYWKQNERRKQAVLEPVLQNPTNLQFLPEGSYMHSWHHRLLCPANADDFR
jgi:hypothetical protein